VIQQIPQVVIAIPHGQFQIDQFRGYPVDARFRDVIASRPVPFPGIGVGSPQAFDLHLLVIEPQPDQDESRLDQSLGFVGESDIVYDDTFVRLGLRQRITDPQTGVYLATHRTYCLQ